MQPNFLFVFPDQHRADWSAAAPGLPLITPNLDRLRRDGVEFLQAFTPSPLCSPARACLATGRAYQHCGVRGNSENTPLSIPNYFQYLRDVGYEVAGVGKFDLHKADRDWGIDGSQLLNKYGFTQGIDNEGKGDAIASFLSNNRTPKGPYMQYLAERGLAEAHVAMYAPYRGTGNQLNFAAVTDLPDEAYCDNWIAGNAVNFLRNFNQEQPWHLVVNFTGPHDPYDVTSSMRERWKDVVFPPAVDHPGGGEASILERRQNYAAMIENIDAHLGRLMDLVEERGELDRTVIVYASDHGEMLGDHQRWAKSVWYHPSTRIPLLVSGPNVVAGLRCDSLVSLQDLAATFLDYSQASSLPDADSRSLRPVLEGRTEDHRSHITSGLHNWRMVFDGRYKLVFFENADPLLYDLQTDPSEITNIAGQRGDLAESLALKL